jgi:hypothetical protein
MKIQGFPKTGLTLAAATIVAFSTANIFAQETNAFGPYEMSAGVPPETPTTAPALSAMPTTPLSSADAQILQLAQAKISDGTIITFIQNSGTVFGLDASQIVYLKQQGVSEGVINAMLNQRSAMAAAQQQQQQQQQQQTPPTPDQSAAAQQYAVAQPSTPAPSTVYIVPDSSASYYNSWAAPYWNSYPGYVGAWGWPVGWGWGGWGWGWRGGGFHGGFHSGFNAGFHSGFNSGFHGSSGFGGGFHGGGGFHK